MSRSEFGSSEKMDDWSLNVQRIMEEMSNRSFVEYRGTGMWQPRVNLYACHATFRICVELAGLELDALHVRCADDKHVTLSGHRRPPGAAELKDPFSVEAMEIDEGPFLRDIDLPEPVNVGAVRISYDRGYLWITLPKTTRT